MPVITVKPCTLVLFGALGDLALRKLFPALYQLDRAGLLHAETRILALARETGDSQTRLAAIDDWLHRYVPVMDLDGEVLERFRARLSYLRMDFTEVADYAALVEEVAG